MKASIKLVHGIGGWSLVPTYGGEPVPYYENLYLLPVTGGSLEALTMLYCQDWEKMKHSERVFHKGSVEQAKDHIRTICKEMNVRVSFCGKKNSPTVRLWWEEDKIPAEKISVDLKWSCWSRHREIWDERCPGIWERMEKAFSGCAGPVEVNTGPRKEIRYGSVKIFKGGAEGAFWELWDDAEQLAEVLGTKPDEAFESMIPYSSNGGEVGLDWEFNLKARKFRSLMERIDDEEGRLCAKGEEEWNFIKSCFKDS